MALTKEQMLTMLEHDEDNDIWLLHQNGEVSFVSGDQDVKQYQGMNWPRYLWRSSAVLQYQRAWGDDGAVVALNRVIDSHITVEPTVTARVAASLGASLASFLGKR